MQTLSKPIFLCGYTSSGKTTIGKLLAKRLDLPFFDTDQMLEQQTGMTPQAMFARYGETYFRQKEQEIARQFCAFGPSVVSTGGGMLTLPENAQLLSAHGTIVHIDRPFEDCYQDLQKTPDRPLIRNNTKEQLLARYEERQNAYRAYARCSIKNDGAPEDAVTRILSVPSLFFGGPIGGF